MQRAVYEMFRNIARLVMLAQRAIHPSRFEQLARMAPNNQICLPWHHCVCVTRSGRGITYRVHGTALRCF